MPAGPGRPAGPIAPATRYPAPDVARGLALLGIALANVVVMLWGRPTLAGSRPVDGSTADRTVDLVVTLLVDNRAYPLFVLLLGYGVSTVLSRQAAAGVPWDDARRLLTRRGVVLCGVGAAHVLLLFWGDILLPYGLLTLALLGLVRRPDRSLAVVAILALVPLAVVSAGDGVATATPADGGIGCLAPTTVLLGLVDRACGLGLTLVSSVLLVPALLAPALLGVLAARAGLLADPAAHRRLLGRLAAGGTALSLVGGLPLALVVAGLAAPSGTVTGLLAVLHGLTGVAGGVAAAALVALWTTGRTGRRVRSALAATGERSMSAYLAQSVVLVPLLAPWAAGLGAELGTAGASLLAAGVWLATVVGAVLLARAGLRGPAEAVVRRLVHGVRPVPPASPRPPRAAAS